MTLGRYAILAPIGAGGMGEVYQARDTELRRDVAIKVLPAAFSSEPERLQRFEREARAASQPGIPPRVSTPALLFKIDANTTAYDVSPDGQRFLFVNRNERSLRDPAMRVLVAWPRAMEDRAD